MLSPSHNHPSLLKLLLFLKLYIYVLSFVNSYFFFLFKGISRDVVILIITSQIGITLTTEDISL